MTVEPGVVGKVRSHDPEAVRLRDRRNVWHTWSPITSDRARWMFVRGDGYRVWDVDDNEYIDAWSLNGTCGFAHPDVAGALYQQALRFHGVDISVASHDLVGALAQRIASYLSSSAKTLFVNSGSEGIEAAIMIASGYWSHREDPRSRVVAFTRGYHGSTLISRSLSGLPRVGHSFAAPFEVTHVDLPAEPRELRQPELLPALLTAFEAAVGAGDPPMAVVVEPFLNVGGGVVLPVGFLQGLRDLCDSMGTLVILDEVFTGYGRAGAMFACHRENMLPHILVSSKGLASGYAPIGAVTVDSAIHDTFEKEPFIGGLRYGHTTSGHAVACAAALATLDLIERENLAQRAEDLGARLASQLEALQGFRDVVDVRRLGLIVVVEFSSYEEAERVTSRARDQGLLVRQMGEVVMAVPPLTIDEEGLVTVADRLSLAVRQ